MEEFRKTQCGAGAAAAAPSAIIAASKTVTRRITGITVRRRSQAFFDSIDPVSR
jgi:hypothetical protein